MKRDDPQDDAFDALLLPISDASPGGDDLLHGPEFDAIAEARREDDPTLPRGVWTAELKRADWPLAARLCREALATRSKDLQVAAWLGEAWIALEGLAGGVRATGWSHCCANACGNRCIRCRGTAISNSAPPPGLAGRALEPRTAGAGAAAAR
ncbi:hypothetical protein G4G28_13625 [Massilia sp. Dwa41.01b]|uniref:type VI secretion system ImpA family N-terminal domain-containing protein n=1 Tax=Massilia sp. Dwa41.01b TaxID=2709302 RepID=UPI0016011B81|nr:type VI secretion system ImpA family N-terminal domain-containing protein [Massilia sp. Dwa41.01b]QNA89248.1 hypothetical protein G4G28_13625 [Massilia sp. Dwa41.01b]